METIMGFRFWRRIKIFPGVTLNISKSGISLSFGIRGFKYTIGQGGKRMTVGLPGTGLSFTKHNDNVKSEYVCIVDWMKTVSRDNAKWRSSPKLYTTTHVRASLDGQLDTLKFLEKEFDFQIREMLL